MTVRVLKQRVQGRHAALSKLLSELDGPLTVPRERVVPPGFEQCRPVWEVGVFAEEKRSVPPEALHRVMGVEVPDRIEVRRGPQAPQSTQGHLPQVRIRVVKGRDHLGARV